MRNIILLSVLLLAGYTQSYALGKKTVFTPSFLQKDNNGAFFYEKVVTVPDSSKEVLYALLKRWVLVNVKTTDKNAVFEGFDIITTPTLALPETKGGIYTYTNQGLNFKMVISVKDGKFKIEASSFIYYGENYASGAPSTGPLDKVELPAKLAQAISEKIDGALNAFMGGLEQAAIKKSSW